MPALTEVSNLVESFDPELVVYVEGPSDHQFLTWGILRKVLEKYDRERRIKLSISVPDGTSGAQAGGCRAVIEHVRNQVSQGKNVFGILDRDVILREGRIDIFLEPDDNKFREDSKSIVGENVWCLTRWEFENYLLCEIDLLEQHIAYSPGNVRAIRSDVEVVRDIFSHADLVSLLVAVNLELSSHAPSHPQLRDNFGKQEKTRSALTAAIEKQLAKIFGEKNINTDTALASYHSRLAAFMEGEPPGTLNAWLKFTRILNGKMLVARLFSGPQSSESSLIHIARALGERIINTDCAAREFSDAIDSFAQRLERTLKQDSGS